MADKKKRPYTFKNTAYWEGLKTPKIENEAPIKTAVVPYNSNWSPQSIAMSKASTYSPGRESRTSTLSRRNRISTSPMDDELTNLQNMPLPFGQKGGNISISDMVDLCKRVYANVAIFRNTVDIMAEFSAADVYFVGGNAAGRSFFTNWAKKAKINKLQAEHYREYFTTGNSFIYAFMGSFSEEGIRKLKSELSLAVKANEIPMRFTIIDPSSVIALGTASFQGNPYRKVLNQYELEQLKNRATDEDKAIFRALPEEIRALIDSGQWDSDGVWMPLNSDRVTPIFYKKQPYEAFATPFGYPVFRDLNAKEEMKKVDQAITRTVENVILLVTMGAKPEEGGIDEKAMEKMQELLAQESVGRILVSDWTTKAEFVTPDIGDVLNPQKYEVLNRDIREGLLNVGGSEGEKFANGMMKTMIFVERMQEGRTVFLEEFLQPMVNKISKLLGFKKAPTAKIKGRDLRDELQFMKAYTRLIEIGVLTPDQGVEAMETGILPDKEVMEEAQAKLVEDRKKGYYNPLVGGVPMAISPDAEANRKVQKELGDAKIAVQGQKAAAGSSATGRPQGSKAPQTTKNVSPIGTSNAHLVGVKALRETMISISSLMKDAEEKVKAKYSLSELNQGQKDMVFKLTQNVISTTKKEGWSNQLASVLEAPEKSLAVFVKNEVTDAVADLALEHQVDTFNASILYHSKWQQ